MSQQYAILSDIHGNSWALEQVLQDITRRGINQIINLGDLFYGPLFPRGTAELLSDFSIITIQGNEDRALYEDCGDNPNKDFRMTVEYTRRHLAGEHIEWLKTLPKTQIVADEIFLCHGTPFDDEMYLLEDISQGSPQLKTNVQLRKLLKDIQQPIILCGHSHIQRTVYMPDGRLIVNPGSVGLPAYSDDYPVFHKMETGSPHASYAILSRDKTNWRVEHLKIPYDWEKAAQIASENQRADWAKWLRMGRG